MSQLPLGFPHPTSDPERLFRPWEFSSSLFPITNTSVFASVGQSYPMLHRDADNSVLAAVGRELVERGFLQSTHPHQRDCAEGGVGCQDDEHSNDISPRSALKSEDMQPSELQSVDWDEPRAKVLRASPNDCSVSLQVLTNESSINSQHMESPEISHNLWLVRFA